MNITELLRKTVPGGFLVGGAVRDALSGRPAPDIDIVFDGGGIAAKSRLLAKNLGGTAFLLDERTQVYRITAPDGAQIDVSAFQGGDLEEDLLRRDFTVNAMAYPLSEKFSAEISASGAALSLDPAKVIDPAGGKKDLKAKKLRLACKTAFTNDPLRMLRAFRISAELGYSPDAKLLPEIKKHRKLINSCAGERRREELLRLLAAGKSAYWLALMDKAGLLTALFPELEAQRKCATVYYGKGGVLKHTLAVVDRMEYLLDSLGTVFPAYEKNLAPLRKDTALLKLAALLHDIAKPATAKKIDGRLRFFLHESKGARMAEETLSELRMSRAETRLISAMIREHLRPGNLASNFVITEKAVYRFFKDAGAGAIPLLLLCWSDYASYISCAQIAKLREKTWEPPFPLRKKLPREGVEKTLRHLQVVNLMFRLYFQQSPKIMPQKLIDGNDIMKTLKLKPGPEIGKLLELVRVGQVEGKISTKAEALAFLKKRANSRKC